MIVRTEMMKAYSEATLQELRNWEVKKVKVLAEFRSMRDDKVCSKCESLDGEIFTLDGASGIIPVHPSCRCIFLPVLGEE
jgi:SPP1 gp7 family putative phage head morphogenesis protein